MTPVYQSVFDPNCGDCLRACIASLLDMPGDQVPNWTGAHRTWEAAWYACVRWLWDRGYELLCVRDLDDGRLAVTGWESRYVLTHVKPVRCPDPRYRGRGHVVVGCVSLDGVELVHDPDPGGWALRPGAVTVRGVDFLIPAHKNTRAGTGGAPADPVE